MQGYNKYYPPDYDGKSILNALNGKNGLGKRARKPGLLVVRFAMPFDIYCGGCEKLISRGIRFNAEKSRNGDYYSLPIWQFSMKCHNCGHGLIIKTDPANTAYSVISGGRLSAKEIKAAVERKLATRQEDEDPLAKLEKNTALANVRAAEADEISRLYSRNEQFWVDTFGSSQKLRKIFRDDKKKANFEAEQMKKIQEKLSLNISIVQPTIGDTIAAKEVSFDVSKRSDSLKHLVKEHLDVFGKRNGARSKTDEDRLVEYSDSD